ncbi:MAG: hypothetical protein ACRDHZ_04140, partial [Ktedonobacteraceae bacterium]
AVSRGERAASMSMRKSQPKNTEVKTRDVNATIKLETALKLSMQGKSWDEIAASAGYASRGAAHNAVMRELNRNVAKDVEELRTRDLHTLAQMQGEVWELFTDKENKGRLFAADRLLAIMERRARLMGLDQSTGAAIAAAQVVIREVPSGYLGEPTV